jgi:hypothetical protein
MAQILYNRLFSHEFSEAELACLLKVFIVTDMVKPEHINLKIYDSRVDHFMALIKKFKHVFPLLKKSTKKMTRVDHFMAHI